MDRVAAAIFTGAFAVAIGFAHAATVPSPPDVPPTRESLWLGSPGDLVASDDPLVLRAQRVDPNVLGVARAPDQILLTTSSGSGYKFQRLDFDARAGIDVDEGGNIIVDPNPARLSYYWYGTDGDATATITVSAGVMQATITGSVDRLALLRDRHGVDVLQTLDGARLNRADCLTAAVPVSAEHAPKSELAMASAADSFRRGKQPIELRTTPIPARGPKYNVELGVVFHYTPAALSAVSATNDPAALVPIADAAMDQLRTAMQNAGQSIHIRPVRVGPLVPINYDETPAQSNPTLRFSAHRKFLIDRWDFDEAYPIPGDGIDILNSREDFGGDLLVMLVADQGNVSGGGFTGPFGLAVGQRRNCDYNGQLSNRDCDIGPAYRDFAFAVVSVLRATTDYTLAHEVAHMLGSEHDRAGSAGIDYTDWTSTPAPNDVTASFASSYGFRTPSTSGAGRVMDVMGSPFCIPANSSTCWTRKLQFADPTRNFLGTASTAGEQAPANPNQGYGFNARTFRLLAEDVASFYGGAVARPLFWDGFE